jgi:REP element-mobilizing transposase RayT
MGLPRSKYVKEGQEGVYHCFSRCVRRAFLYGFDPLTQRDFSHRKVWLVDRLRYLAAIFAMDVCAYAVMDNHYHTILRTRPDLVSLWSDHEVASRWLTLFPKRRKSRGDGIPILEEEIRALADCRERIAQLRRRLSSLSWFMGRLNEFIARAANKEDEVKGRFWESRFKCQALLDEAAIAACMVYVDLNPIRAGLAETPEGSDFTSIQERIRAWGRETTVAAFVPKEAADAIHPLGGGLQMPEKGGELSYTFSGGVSECWLCPIRSDTGRRGILGMTEAEYIDLVNRSGRITQLDNRGVIETDLAPILMRIGANPLEWHSTVARFGSKFRLAAGLLSNLRNFANQIGSRWLKGVATARAAFAS